MNEKEIFQKLFDIASNSKDPRGIVASCLVKNGEIIASAASSDDGKEHAENILLNKVGIAPEGSILYCTLEPCSKRTDPTMRDCVSAIINAEVKNVVFGGRDPKQSKQTQAKLKEVGITIRQIEDKDVIKRCVEIFNESVSPDNTDNIELKPID